MLSLGSWKPFVAILLSLAYFEAIGADAVKCRDASGRVYVTDGLCPSGSRVERIQGAEYISPERQRQANAVNSMMRGELHRIDAENEAFKKQHRNFVNAVAEEDRRQLQKEQTDKQAKKEEDCIALAKRGRNARYEGMAKGCEWAFEAERSRPKPVPMPLEPNPIITSCDRGGCWDTSGNRYNGSGQMFFRSDGKTCNRVGPSLICN